MTNLRPFLALVRAELRLYLRDRKALALTLLAPILIGAFFGSLFGSGGRPSGVAVAVVDLDRSALSGRVVAALQADPSLKLQVLDEAPALAAVQSGKVRVAAVLPAGLERGIGSALFGAGPRPEVVLHHDPSQAGALAIVRGLLAQTLMQEAGRSVSPGNAGAAGAPSMPYATREVEAVRTEGRGAPAAYNGYAHSFAGMGVQFLLMLGVDMGVGLLLMRRLGLWRRLRAAPLSRATLLGSRMASTALICLGVFVVIWIVAIAAFGVRVGGSWAGLLAILVAFALMTAAFGLFIAALGGTPEATRGLAILATLLMVMLGGAWVPSFLFPEWLQQLTLAIPTRWAVDGLDAMTWRGQGFAAALAPTGVLLGFALLFSALALWRFRWEE